MTLQGPKAVAAFQAGQQVVAQSGCGACHKIGENGNDGPGTGSDGDRRAPAQRRRSSGRSSTRRRRCRPSRVCSRAIPSSSTRWCSSSPRSSSTDRSRHPADGRRPRQRHAGRAAGPGDVRPHRRRLRPHELGHDRGPAPSLAPPRRGPRAGRPGRRRRSTWPPGPATSRSSSRAASAPGARHRLGLLRRDARARARQGPADHLGVGQRARRCPTRTGRFDAVTVGFGARNFSDLGRRPARDGARHAPRRPRRRARDHDTDHGRRSRPSSGRGSTASSR